MGNNKDCPHVPGGCGTPASCLCYRQTPWIGVDLDGTLAEYHGWPGRKIGAPVPAMVERVKRWLAEGVHVRIMTARVAFNDPDNHREVIEAWCQEHLGTVLPVTNEKDFGMRELWDDRAIRVQANDGTPCDACKALHYLHEGKK